ncbi:MAG: hypothetical protein K1X57_07285 [Gemmataceae bacterium]|nr:hypothetical protein [Gemmataceae bacterium]
MIPRRSTKGRCVSLAGTVTMRKTILLATLAAVLLPTMASAAGGATDQWGFKRRSVPRAAPWYLYWPYPAHFVAPAPTGAPGGYGVMTAQPYVGQIGPAGNYYPQIHRSPTGYDY